MYQRIFLTKNVLSDEKNGEKDMKIYRKNFLLIFSFLPSKTKNFGFS